MEWEATLSFLYPWKAVDDHLKIPKAPKYSREIQKISGREEAHGSLGPARGNATSEACNPWTGLLKFWEGAVASQRTIDVCECILDGYRTGSVWSSQSSEHQGKSRLRSRCPDPTPPQPSTPCWQVWQQPRRGWIALSLLEQRPSRQKVKEGEGNLNCDSVATQDGLEITEFNWFYSKIITLTFL